MIGAMTVMVSVSVSMVCTCSTSFVQRVMREPMLKLWSLRQVEVVDHGKDVGPQGLANPQGDPYSEGDCGDAEHQLYQRGGGHQSAIAQDRTGGLGENAFVDHYRR